MLKMALLHPPDLKRAKTRPSRASFSAHQNSQRTEGERAGPGRLRDGWVK